MEALKDYKVGVYFGRYYGEKKAYCACGHSWTADYRVDLVCEKCGNTLFISGGDHPTTKRIHDGVYECIEKNDHSFHVKKKEIIIHFNDDKMLCYFKPSHEWELRYDLRTKEVNMQKNGSEVACFQHDHRNMNQFFKNVRGDKSIIPIIATERSQYLYEFAFKQYGKEWGEHVGKLGRALIRFLNKGKKVEKLELFANAGFGENLYNISRVSDWMDSTETKPHKILRVPKYMLQILRELRTFDKYMVDQLVDLDTLVGGNNVKLAAQIFKEEASIRSLYDVITPFVELYVTYGYKDVRKLALYLAREVKLEQGITEPHHAAQILRDYVRMCRQMEVEPKEKYPKSLKKMHDIAQMNYRTRMDEIKNRKMREAVESEDYQSLTYRKKPYAIVTPNDASDLIKEGSALSHCVASYVNDVIEKRCKILFMRDVEKIDEPLITIEVRDGNIRQVRGFGNRPATAMEMGFIREWSEKKSLKLETY